MTPGAARVLAVFRHPTPYRDSMLDRASELPGVELEVLYLARTFAATPWEAQPLRHRHRFPRGFFHHVRAGIDIAFHPGALFRLLARRPHACVLSGWSDPTILAMALGCRLLGIPYVLVVESFEPARLATGVPSPMTDRVRRLVVRGAKAWLPAGSRAVEYAVSLGAVRERCHPFPTAPDVRRLAALAEEIRATEPGLRAGLGLPDDGVIVFVGRVVRDKAPDVLLDALALLAERRPCRLVIVGSGPLLAGLERHPAARHATFEGFLQPREVVRRLAASDVFVLPSRYETWGAVVTEAMAAGLPAVVSERVGCGPDLLGGDAPPGEIVPVEDPAALAIALERVLARPDRRTTLADHARRRALAWGHDLNLRSLAGALTDAGVATRYDPALPLPAGEPR